MTVHVLIILTTQFIFEKTKVCLWNKEAAPCMYKKVVISAMVVSYDTIRGQKTLQKTSVVKRHFALSSRF